MGLLSNLYDTVELGHFDWPFRNSHPVHPATVHFPLAFFSAAYTLDTLYGTANRFKALAVLRPFLKDISRLGYLCHVAGLVTSLPSFTSGSAELWELYKRGGINKKDKELTHPRSHENINNLSIKIGLAHGALNFVAAGVSTYAVWTRRKVPGFTPGKVSILLSVLTLPGVALSAALGGELVYGKGVGVQRMGNALDEKKQGIKEHANKKD
ncbi:hypothetical protein M436DRAFT_64303 [Aureobasidium namibiae CBS 147.97]|uniref:DUF2231 domain-containing protein n=1 Tax=Aureobasidium namibiae CBS 147.97 TaxID=1043004 RepID=A0A074WTV3_9PEZI